MFTTGRERRGQSAGFQTSAVLQRGLSGATWEAAFSPRRDCLFVEQWPLVAGDSRNVTHVTARLASNNPPRLLLH